MQSWGALGCVQELLLQPDVHMDPMVLWLLFVWMLLQLAVSPCFLTCPVPLEGTVPAGKRTGTGAGEAS